MPAWQEIKSAAKKLWLKVHPDKTKSPGAEAAFRMVKEAEQQLLVQVARSTTAARAPPCHSPSTPGSSAPRTSAPRQAYGGGMDDDDDDDDDDDWGFFDHDFGWENFFQHRREFARTTAAAIAKARAEAQAKQREYEEQIARGVSNHVARQTLASVDSGAIDYSKQVGPWGLNCNGQLCYRLLIPHIHR